MIRNFGKKVQGLGRSISQSDGVMGDAIDKAYASRTGRMVRSKPFIGAMIGGAAVKGFSDGLNSPELSSGVYEALTGVPDLDQYVFGTDMGLAGALTPFPGQRRIQQVGQLVRPHTYSRHAAHAGDTRMPTVDGNIVFGAYQSRMR